MSTTTGKKTVVGRWVVVLAASSLRAILLGAISLGGGPEEVVSAGESMAFTTIAMTATSRMISATQPPGVACQRDFCFFPR